MRRILTILMLFPVLAFSQPYGQEWIDFNKEYYKINIPDNGIYQLTYAELNAAGFPVGSVNPQNLQIFRKGVELAIYVDGESDASFDSGDFIEFYGQKNDGSLDAELYLDPAFQPHQYYSLYSDSAAYFLTYTSAQPGKRMVTTATFTGPPPDPNLEKEIIYLQTQEYAEGFTGNSETGLTQYDLGEGFTGKLAIEISRPEVDITIAGIDLPDIAGPSPELELMVVGRNSEAHELEVLVGPDAGSLTSAGIFTSTGFNTITVLRTLNWADISAGGELVVRLRVVDNGDNRSFLSISYAKLTYARLPNVNNSILLEGKTKTKAGGNVILLQNTLATSKVYEVSDPTNSQIVPDSDANSTTITCGFSNSTIPHSIVVASPSNEYSINKVEFRSITPTNHNFLIISHSSLMQAAGGHTDAVKAYAAYRASNAGGAYDTLVADIDMLYNQFSYGQPTPLAIHNFMKYMFDGGNPSNLFLIGKSLQVNYKYHRVDPTTAYLKGYKDLVPTAGYPGSDLVYTVGLGANPNNMAIPVGRLTATSAVQVVDYLNKVIEIESTPYNALWRKNLLHLSGGNSQFELLVFKSYVDDLKSVAEDHYLGGEVTTISKTTTAPAEQINVVEEVNAGLNLITFFGHSAPNVIDIDIGFVSDPLLNYNNQGKYPALLLNGCNTGNVYTPQYIFVEDWIVTANKGSTDIIAHSGYGYPNKLKSWSDIFYNLSYVDSIYIEKSIGDIMVETGRQFLDEEGPNPTYIALNQVQQMGLQGDPAIKVFGSYKPDYEISVNNVEAVSFNNDEITAELDSFALALGVRNFGAYIKDSLEVVVNRTLPDGSNLTYDTLQFPPARYIDTLIYVISNTIPGNSGNNSFRITLDPQNKIEEHDEMNNEVTYNRFIPRSGTLNLVPYRFAIQSEQDLDLLIQSGNTMAESRGYLFELDSAASYNSLILNQSPTLVGTEVIPWNDVSLEAKDSTAYYWRSKYEIPDPGNEEDKWAESSFTYISGGSPGWAQVAFPQKITNSLSNLIPNQASQTIDFVETDLSIEVKVHGASSATYNYKDTELLIDGLAYILEPSWSICYNNRLNLVAFDKQSTAPYAPVFGNQWPDQWTCGRSPQVINSYNGGKPLDEILDAIVPGDKVLLFTTGNFDFNTLTPTNMAKLAELGADPATLAAKGVGDPYIMFGFKGAGTGNGYTEITGGPTETISYTGVVNGIYWQGDLTSSEIGPALSWSDLNFSVATQDPSDIYGLDIYGKDLDGNETLLFSDVQGPSLDISGIDAKFYPILKLKLHLEDELNLTAPQLRKWIVNYQPAPEGYLAFVDNSVGNKTNVSLQEGESFESNFNFINISNTAFPDSLLLSYTIFNEDRRTSEYYENSLPPLQPGDTIPIPIIIDTKGRQGMNSLEVTVNPLILPEQQYENNTITLNNYFDVIGDNTNPNLDVSFDGEYIFDGDIVSPNPNIRIVIRDENEFLLKTDTTGIDIFLKAPCEGCVAQRVSLSGADVVWTAEVEKEPFTIDYTPKSLEDGIYELSVQVQDASGNSSGLVPYVIHFEVVNKTTVTNFYPYPNPFSTSVKFIFTLTGSEVPDQIMIRIFTVSGRVVREITQDELGPLRIGNNATDYAWDGRDEFGDQLANGVYLYKVYIRQNGQDVELRASSGDRGFKNGYGKLYILR